MYSFNQANGYCSSSTPMDWSNQLSQLKPYFLHPSTGESLQFFPWTFNQFWETKETDSLWKHSRNQKGPASCKLCFFPNKQSWFLPMFSGEIPVFVAQNSPRSADPYFRPRYVVPGVTSAELMLFRLGPTKWVDFDPLKNMENIFRMGLFIGSFLAPKFGWVCWSDLNGFFLGGF